MSNFIVTGAAGFIGSALAAELIQNGHTVVTIDNLSTGYETNIPDGVEFILGDCGDNETIKKIPKRNYDAIFHIAGQSSGEISFDNPVYDISTNTVSTLLLLDYARQHGCDRFIYAGTMSVYGMQPEKPVNEDSHCSPSSFYGVGKLASEHYLKIYQPFGIDTTSLRLFNVYGPGQNLENLRQGYFSLAGWHGLFSPFSVFWVIAFYGAWLEFKKIDALYQIRRFLLLIIPITFGFTVLSSNVGRMLHSLFPLVIPYALIGIDYILSREEN